MHLVAKYEVHWGHACIKLHKNTKVFDVTDLALSWQHKASIILLAYYLILADVGDFARQRDCSLSESVKEFVFFLYCFFLILRDKCVG